MGGLFVILWDCFGLFSLENMLDKFIKDVIFMIRKWFYEVLR